MSLHFTTSDLAADAGLIPDAPLLDHTPKRRARTGRTPAWMLREPSAGRGKPDKSQPPMRLVEGFTGNLNQEMVDYLDDGGVEKWCWERLRERQPATYRVAHPYHRLGMKHREIADELGIALNTATVHSSRAKRLLLGYRTEYHQWRDDRRAAV